MKRDVCLRYAAKELPVKRPEASGNSTAGTSASSIGWKVPHRGEGKVLVGCQDVGESPARLAKGFGLWVN